MNPMQRSMTLMIRDTTLMIRDMTLMIRDTQGDDPKDYLYDP